jgi:rhomboid family protein
VIPLRDDNPTRSTPIITVLLIVANVAVFLLQLAGGDRLTLAFAMIPRDVLQEGRWYTLVSSMFLHGGWVHLLSNMLYLWIFGNNVEDSLGKVRYLFFYFACGAAAGLVHLGINSHSGIPTVGASGAIAGVLGGYIVLFPHARVATLIFLGFLGFIRELPAQIVLGIWFLIQLVNGIFGSGMALGRGGGDTGGVAVWAHVGGFLAGYLLIRVLGSRPPEPPRRRPAFMDY